IVTASPQPSVMTIQPASSAFDHFNNTPPTTPTPKVISTIVPNNSAINSVINILLLSLRFIINSILFIKKSTSHKAYLSEKYALCNVYLYYLPYIQLINLH